MPWLKSTIDFITLGSERPVRRLVAYYAVLGVLVSLLIYLFPVIDLVFSGERLEQLTGSRVLQDGLATTRFPLTEGNLPPRLELVLSTGFSLLGTLVLMLPVSWVYMSVQRSKGQGQTIVQTLIILPIAVAGLILVVRNSLALAFSLAGVMAGVRFRTTLTDARDLVFVFVAIGVGFAAGVQVMTVAVVLSIMVNFVLLFTWRYGFGRNLLEPAAATTQWAEPLQELAKEKAGEKVPDRDVLVALSPKKLEALEERFDRLRALAGGVKKPRFNSILWVATNSISETQQGVEKVLGAVVKRWVLDEVITNQGKPSELFYLIRLRKGESKDQVLTAIRSAVGATIEAADIEVGAAHTTGKAQ